VATTYDDALAIGSARATLIPQDPDTLLGRRENAHALTAAGYKTSPATLATKASRGGGPPFRRWGRIPLYRWGDSLDWARSRLGPPIRSTSEADAASPALADDTGDLGPPQPPAEILTEGRGHRTPFSAGPPATAPSRRARSRPEEPAAG
jgi:hypothetical protein